jgi:hypothetical protein
MLEKLTVTWLQQDVLACCDKNIEAWYQRILALEDKELTTFVATELQVLRLRVGVKEGELPPFCFKVEDSIYQVGRNGRYTAYPHQPEFEISDNLLDRLMF